MSLVILILAIIVAVRIGINYVPKDKTQKPQEKETGAREPKAKDKKPESKKKPEAPIDPASSLFLIKPIIQLGTAHTATTDGIAIVWNVAAETGIKWAARIRSLDIQGAEANALSVSSIDIPELAPVGAHVQYTAIVSGMSHGERFTYDIMRNDQVVFTASAASPKPRGAPFRFVAVGDIGEGNPGEAKVFYQISKFNPDFVVIPGDLAYKRGRFSENLKFVYPVTNSDTASPETGAPLMRSTLFAACPGNHDCGRPKLGDIANFDEYPDLLAFFYLWSQPLNGPYVGSVKGVSDVQPLVGEQTKQDAFLKASAGRYPRMGNFSFDYGDSHWLFLDANEHMDWSTEDLREWVRRDLSTTSMRWKFVVFHQPAFTSHTRHRVEQRMRLLVDIFQDTGVDLCINGHAHWYERMFPLKFFIKRHADEQVMDPTTPVDGDFQIDRSFDGASNTRPDGVIYLVSGAGGANLHTTSAPVGNLEPFTYKIVADRYSFTVVDMDSNTMIVRQISEDGEEIDRFTVHK